MCAVTGQVPKAHRMVDALTVTVTVTVMAIAQPQRPALPDNASHTTPGASYPPDIPPA